MTASPAIAPPLPHRSGAVFARMGRNVLWIVGGRGFQAVASLVYLGLAARTLGMEGFGAFSLVLAYGQAIANIAQFQSWQTVIRYGMHHLARGHGGRLGRLLGLTAVVDCGGALAGAAIAGLGVALVGAWLGWSGAEQQRAAWFGIALLLSIGATPTGMLRLVDRFDLIAYCQAVGPLVRLIGSIAAWILNADIGLFLASWAAAALLQHAATWIAALLQPGMTPRIGPYRFLRAARENQGIWRFMFVTNAAGSIGLLTEQVATLAVGGAAGASAAGGFRIAAKIARALARPVQIAGKVLYPELARLHARDDRETLDHIVVRTGRVSLVLAAAIIVIAVAGGSLLIRALAGDGYAFAHGLLVILAIGVAIDLSGFSLEPLLTARGRADSVLRIRVLGALVFGALLLALLGPMGATRRRHRHHRRIAGDAAPAGASGRPAGRYRCFRLRGRYGDDSSVQHEGRRRKDDAGGQPGLGLGRPVEAAHAALGSRRASGIDLHPRP